MSLKETALELVAEDMGYDNIMDAVEGEGWAHDSVIVGTCRNACGFINYSVEPDACNYHCEECNTETVDSVLVLLGVI